MLAETYYVAEGFETVTARRWAPEISARCLGSDDRELPASLH